MVSETKPLDRRQSRRAAEIESTMQSEVEIRQWQEHS